MYILTRKMWYVTVTFTLEILSRREPLQDLERTFV